MGKRRGTSSPGGIHTTSVPLGERLRAIGSDQTSTGKGGDRSMPTKKKAPAKKAKKPAKKK